MPASVTWNDQISCTWVNFQTSKTSWQYCHHITNARENVFRPQICCSNFIPRWSHIKPLGWKVKPTGGKQPCVSDFFVRGKHLSFVSRHFSTYSCTCAHLDINPRRQAHKKAGGWRKPVFMCTDFVAFHPTFTTDKIDVLLVVSVTVKQGQHVPICAPSLCDRKGNHRYCLMPCGQKF